MQKKQNTTNQAMEKFTKSELIILITLAIIQFSHIVDFMILMPLGPRMMPVFNVAEREFGWLVAIYSFSAALAGFISIFVINKVSHKRFLLVSYIAFGLATLGCGLTKDFYSLLICRALAGAFGGILTSLTLMIVSNIIAYQKRGRATGIVMSGFPLATVVGVPASLWLASKYDWHMPFFVLAGLSAICLIAMIKIIPPSNQNTAQTSTAKALIALLSQKKYWYTFIFLSLTVLGAFTVIPYISQYFVKNLKFNKDHLDEIYFIGGVATLLSSQIIGWLSDRFGKHTTYWTIACLSILPILWITHLENWFPNLAIVASTAMFVLVSGRSIPGMALASAVPPNELRSIFMSLASFFQQLAMGCATLLGGLIISSSVTENIRHYDRVGFVAVGMTILAMCFIGLVKADDSVAAKMN